ncbi:MAG: hypothetical protein EOP48_20890 [Sphingobacteriales bacterium]|nr:MAG: hypothetical protein EOP48_20890 [Sphingobacteriales bacterium]
MWFLQGVEKFRMITVLSIISKIIYLLGVFTLVSQPSDYIYVNFSWGMGMLIPYLYGFLFCKKKYHLRSISVGWRDISGFLSVNFRFCLSQMFVAFKNYAPILVINFMGGFAIAGLYKVIEQIIMPMRSYLQMFYRYFYPKLCYEMDNDIRKGMTYWKKISLLNIVAITGMLSLIVIFPLHVLQFFKVSAANIELLENPLRLATLIPLAITISYSLEQLLLSQGKKDFYIQSTIIAVITNFFVMVGLYNWLGFYGLILSLISSEVVVIALICLSYNRLKPALS